MWIEILKLRILALCVGNVQVTGEWVDSPHKWLNNAESVSMSWRLNDVGHSVTESNLHPKGCLPDGLYEYRVRLGSLQLTVRDYRQTSNIKRTESQNLNIPPLVVQLCLPNPLKLGVKSRMKM